MSKTLYTQFIIMLRTKMKKKRIYILAPVLSGIVFMYVH